MRLCQILLTAGLIVGLPSICETLSFSWNPTFQAPVLRYGPDLPPAYHFREALTVLAMVQNDLSSEHPIASAEPPNAAQAPDAAHATSPTHAEDAGPRQRWPWYLAGIVVAASIGGVLRLIYAPKPNVRMNDAYVQVHYTTVAPRVLGQVDKVAVDNNQVVKTGEILVTLDGRDYRTTVNSAEAALARDRASVAIATAALQRQQSAIDQSKSQLDTATAQLAMAQADADRYEELASTGACSVKTRQQADTALLQGEATLDGARASLDSARVTLKVLRAQEDAAKATVDADDAALDQARLNLSYTEMRAPLDGMVAQRSVQVGNYVGPGAGLMAVVPLHDVDVEANYQESQLKRVKAGQSVRIHIDAYGITSKAPSWACWPQRASPSRQSRQRTPPATSARSCSGLPSRAASNPASLLPSCCMLVFPSRRPSTRASSTWSDLPTRQDSDERMLADLTQMLLGDAR